jgi:hypothetical protein
LKELGDAHAAVAPCFGTMEEFRDAAARGDRCALVARVRYAPDVPVAAGDSDGAMKPAPHDLARQALLVVVKPAVTRFAPLDVKLYAAAKPQFPQQPTGDQFFDEGQWESYRKLGLEIGLRVFGAWDGYVKVARSMAAGA